MNLQPSQEQESIAASAAEFLCREIPTSRVRELADDDAADAIDEDTWRRCAEIGWVSLGLPTETGGIGLGLPEETLLLRELGRHLTPGPFRSTILGGHVAALAGDHELAGSIAAGARRVGMSVGEVALDLRPGDLVLVLSGTHAGLHEVGEIEPVAGVDPGTRFAHIEIGREVVRVESPAIMDRARVLAAAEQLGIIEAVRDMSAQYAKTRVQFGQAIGAFQAVKHRCADMAIAAYSTVGEVFQAAVLVGAGRPDAGFHAAAAYILATRGAKTSTADNILNLGGIGFTWEQDAHLFLKRALLLEHVLGPLRDTYRVILGPRTHEF
ncbi:hypothetical protein A5712_27900 [Mycobacterium sp. E2327]|uniref:acyl-CoA dehydrogenase family protein n=1 Tax=Mycobacterium sp. E2327 TaxID=1834132 RepID=UPI0007FFFE7C|nr:acyl-CoA dehydrogenase family protein [Mycobacterium sp. E2327]OBI15745.1 hypothetical protein A5712_27900 [Mycobacterium sp. E2327]